MNIAIKCNLFLQISTILYSISLITYHHDCGMPGILELVTVNKCLDSLSVWPHVLHDMQEILDMDIQCMKEKLK